ncbi:phospholipase D delta isoform X2 [Cryptomeria japonica]|uniref:phospholipase D delta isoform X2 n=1 Tax=Cryptomeria japonica TaxID=3369 RepID=UPI0027DAA79C|nr:phospholipase D delta isoform X2 [Cryptomeria japonica]
MGTMVGSSDLKSIHNEELSTSDSFSTEDRKVILHGTLDVWIFQARALPNMDLFSERLRQCFSIFTACRKPFYKLKGHGEHRKIITSDPYVSVQLADATVAQTRVINNCQHPIWNEHFVIQVAHPVDEVRFVVKDDDLMGADFIGTVAISAERVLRGEKIEDWFPVLGANGLPPKPNASLRIAMEFSPAENNPLFGLGVGSGPNYQGVPRTYFPLRKCGMITLYQDAHGEDNSFLNIKLQDGRLFERKNCWEDMCHAILEAHHLVYIAGWSIYTKIKLIREHTRPLPRGGNLNLGELLKFKSQEGLRVLLLVWDDKTSHDSLFIKTDGIMQTHDEETRKFFNHSSVHCVLSPRYASSKLSWFKQQVVGTLYTHHQKIVIVDAETGSDDRRLISFIGGLDMCDGRYDTPRHPLFKTLKTSHKDDYHNPTFAGTVDTGGPREPWHDMHCKIEGPAAYDVLTNFEQRWRKATKWRNIDGDDPETWHVQVFRSIDSGSVKGFPKSAGEAESQNLVCGKNLVIDMSIHTAYIMAIRSAQHFIYIENQYFIGSSYNWLSYKNAGANNMIPIELALKVASKIRRNERFAVYIVIPMWPEGVPTSAVVQEILFWQGQTMQMMYNIIANALQDAGMSETYHPQDYLNFYCLGNRETNDENVPLPTCPPAGNSIQGQVQKYRRFMIYVHAKGMIVDDEYVMLGSANINQRSLDGSRDTEIAMGSYQPHYTWDQKKCHPRGQVYGYRMSLWAEHLGTIEDCFLHPERIECVKRVNSLAEQYWNQFVAEEVTDLKGHLLKYPVQVDANGKVGPLPGHEVFPDVGGKVLGAPASLPCNLTT